MNYQTTINTLDDFYKQLYRLSARNKRIRVTPRQVTANLLTLLGKPQTQYSSVLITGSKGKGSTAIILANFLRSAGLKIGMFSSPHLFDYRERIKLNEHIIPIKDLLRLSQKVFSAANQLVIEHPDERPRFFEITTAIAYCYFAEQRVDYAVVETGIGALTDATNQSTHCLSILTHIEKEHADIFGDMAGIAKEKSGVIKPNTPLVLGDIPLSVESLILEKAAQCSAPIYRAEKPTLNTVKLYQINFRENNWQTNSWVKAQNASLAITAVQTMMAKNNENNLSTTSQENNSLFTISNQKIITLLHDIQLPARQEIVSKKPLIIVDGAHTQTSAENLARFIDTIQPKKATITLLVSFSAKKNIAPVISPFAHAKRIVLTEANTTRSLPTEEIEKELSDIQSGDIVACKDPLIALDKALELTQANDLLIVTGSIYIAGLISQHYSSANNKKQR